MNSTLRVGSTPFLIPSRRRDLASSHAEPRLLDIASPFKTFSPPPTQTEREGVTRDRYDEPQAMPALSALQRAGCAVMAALALSGVGMSMLNAQQLTMDPLATTLSQTLADATSAGRQTPGPSPVGPVQASPAALTATALAQRLQQAAAAPQMGAQLVVHPPPPATVAQPSDTRPTPPEQSPQPAALPSLASAPLPASFDSTPPSPVAVAAPLPLFASMPLPAFLNAYKPPAPAHPPATHSPSSRGAQAVHSGTQRRASHEITDAVNRYVRQHQMGNPYLLRELQVGSRAGATIGTVGMAGASVVAITGAHSALALGAAARGLGAAAQGMGAAARSAGAVAAATHNAAGLAQAAQMGAQASQMGAQAAQIGGRAAQIGGIARTAAAVAAPLSIVGGALAVLDGGVDVYTGWRSSEGIEALQAVAQHRLAQLQHAGKADRAVMREYRNVMRVLDKAEEQAEMHEAFGAAKIVFGGMMIAAPFTGPAAPIVGGVGAVGYIGTVIAQHVMEDEPEAPILSARGHHSRQAQQADEWSLF